MTEFAGIAEVRFGDVSVVYDLTTHEVVIKNRTGEVHLSPAQAVIVSESFAFLVVGGRRDRVG